MSSTDNNPPVDNTPVEQSPPADSPAKPESISSHSKHSQSEKSPASVNPTHTQAPTSIELWKAYIVLFGTTLSYVIYIAALQSMNVALPFVAIKLDFKLTQTQWIQSAYTLSAACLTLLFVAMSETFGAKKVWIFGTTFFVIWSAALAASQTSTQFITFRALEGIGSAAILPAGFGIISQVFPERRVGNKRTLAMAIFSSGAPIGSGVGTIFGGVPTQYAHTLQWRITFIIFAVLGVISLLCTPLIPKSPVRKLPGGVDYAGTALITIGLTLFLFVLSQSQDVGWGTGYIIALLIVGILFMIGFVIYEVWVERKGWTPMMRMSNFTKERFAVAMAIAFVGWGAFTGWDYWTAQYYGRFAGYDPIHIMERFLPQAIFAFIGAFTANFLLMRISGQWVFIGGAAFASGACLIFTFAKPTILYWKLEFWAFILGISGACWMYASATVYAIQVVSSFEAPMAGSLTTTLNNMSTSFTLTISTIVAVNNSSPDDPRRTYVYGQWTCFGMGIAGLLLAIFGLRGIGVISKVGKERRLQEQDMRDAEERGELHPNHPNASIEEKHNENHLALATTEAPIAAD